MKIIGVEFRAGIRNHVFGQKQIELFLHPIEVECPEILGAIDASVTVHTTNGDITNNFQIRQQSYGPVDQEAMTAVTKSWLKKYGSLDLF